MINSMQLSQDVDELMLTAIHEAAHAVLARETGIEARGRVFMYSDSYGYGCWGGDCSFDSLVAIRIPKYVFAAGDAAEILAGGISFEDFAHFGSISDSDRNGASRAQYMRSVRYAMKRLIPLWDKVKFWAEIMLNDFDLAQYERAAAVVEAGQH